MTGAALCTPVRTTALRCARLPTCLINCQHAVRRNTWRKSTASRWRLTCLAKAESVSSRRDESAGGNMKTYAGLAVMVMVSLAYGTPALAQRGSGGGHAGGHGGGHMGGGGGGAGHGFHPPKGPGAYHGRPSPRGGNGHPSFHDGHGHPNGPHVHHDG